jgi:hypothetical protein
MVITISKQAQQKKLLGCSSSLLKQIDVLFIHMLSAELLLIVGGIGF